MIRRTHMYISNREKMVTSSSTILRLKDVRLSAGKREILKGLSISVNRGDAVTIMGPNGSGKTTLLKVALGLLKPSAGELYFFEEKNISNKNRKFLGYIPQNLALINERDVFSNIIVGAIRRMPSWRSLFSIYPKEITHEAYKIMNMLGISQLARSKVKTLSGGEKQRVAIARTIIQKPSIIFADEITASLDFRTAAEVMDILTSIKNKTNAALVMTHHNPEIARKYSKRICIMQNGKMLKEILPSDLDMEHLANLYETDTTTTSA
jgi:phosphonate transport system ATP-binding protein